MTRRSLDAEPFVDMRHWGGALIDDFDYHPGVPEWAPNH